MKKARLLIISSVILTIAFIIFVLVFPANKSTKENKGISFISPTPSALEEIKGQLATNYKIDDFINIEYRGKSDLFIVFYKGDQTQAKEKINSFFQKLNVSSPEIKELKIEYIGLDRGKDESPSGFGQF